MTATRRAARMAGCVLAAVLATAPVAAQAQAPTLDLAFRPPTIAPQAVCTRSGSGSVDPAQAWAAWDGNALPDAPIDAIRRDLAQLRAQDPIRWFDTIWRAIDLMETHPDAPTEESVLLMRAAALEAAGRFPDLTKAGYITRLAAMGDALPISSRFHLSRYLAGGIGIAPDPARADALLVEAGYAGDVRALMALARRQLQGSAPADWAIPVELTVTTALTTMLGDIDTGLCDRARDIALAYRSGALLTPDAQLAHDWYRFAADMGDANAAWRVASDQSRAEGIARDTKAMLRYLSQAAEAGLPHARIERARLLETGALVPRDLDGARAILDAVAETGDAQAILQRALFLRRHAEASPDWAEARRAAIHTLAEAPDAPAWAFRDMADTTLAQAGLWAGRDAALALYDKAAALGDAEAQLDAARLRLRLRPTTAQVDAALDAFDADLHRRGGPQAAKEAVAALVCRAQGPIDIAAVRAWQDRHEAVNGDANERLAGSVLDLDPALHPLTIAALQSEALHGSPTRRAEWRRVMESASFAAPDAARHWRAAAPQDAATFAAQIAVDIALFPALDDMDMRLAALRARHAKAGPAFGAEINARLFDAAYGPDALARLTDAEREAALSVLHRDAQAGLGHAMTALAAQHPLPQARAALYDRYRDVIAARGDFAAQVFAARHADDPSVAVARARGAMPCDFNAAMDMLRLARDRNDQTGIDRWLTAAELLSDDEASRLRQIAGTVLDLRGADGLDRAKTLYARAADLGDAQAARALFAILLDDATPAFDPDRALTMMVAAHRDYRGDVLAGYIAAVEAAEPRIAATIEARIDMTAIAARAAQSGDRAAMRLYALRLRDSADGPAGIAEAANWLARAAEAGDATAMMELGQMLAFGIGIKADRATALRWLDRAAGLGHARATEITRLVRLSEGS